jgi:phosphoribosylaminoimidazole (AIR) synthetase
MEKDAHRDIPHEDEAINIGGYGAAFKISSIRAVDPATFRSATGQIVKEIAEACMRKGAKAIGHVKLYLKAQSGYLQADTVGMKYGVHIEGDIARPERVADLVVNSIIIGLGKTEVASATLNSIREVMERHGFNISQVEETRGKAVRREKPRKR